MQKITQFSQDPFNAVVTVGMATGTAYSLLKDLAAEIPKISLGHPAYPHQVHKAPNIYCKDIPLS